MTLPRPVVSQPLRTALLPAAPGPALPDWRRDLLLAVLGLALLLAWDFSGLDLPVLRLFGSAQGFPWRGHWLTRDVLHEGGRLLAWAVFVGLGLDLRFALLRGPSRRERRYGLAATLACLVAIPTLKRFSATSCPWDLAEFGGRADYVSHWAPGLSDGGPGHCFPSGHAVAAFAFLSPYFLLRGHRPVAARRWLIGVLLVGSAFGAAQLARGAHPPSHTLWSAWLCWVICATLAAVAARRPCRNQARRHAGTPPDGSP